MCGIVFVGSSTMTKRNLDLFERLLFADTFRGPHSTGVFTSRVVGPKERKVQVNPYTKKALDGPSFLKTAEWELLRTGSLPVYDKKTEKYDVPIANYGNYYVGHNRYATMGAINSKNAHPFRHGKITMVHNGTLTDQTLLPKHKEFEVDSENICYSLDTIGVNDTIQKLDGAFTLVWHNRETNTLHFIRNDERPFHIVETTTGDFYGASEENMLLWILKRGKIKTYIKENYELKVGKEYIFDVSNQKFSFKESIEHKLPKFNKWLNYNNGYNGYGGYGMYGCYNRNVYDFDRKSINDKEKLSHTQKALREIGLNLKEKDPIIFTATHTEAYPSSENRGKLVGYLQEINDYVEVISHCFDISDLKENYSYEGKIESCYDNYGLTTIVVSDPEVIEENSFVCKSCKEVLDRMHEKDNTGYCDPCHETFLDIPFSQEEEKEDVKILTNGWEVTEKNWNRINQCSCGEILSWEIAENVEFINSFPICPSCNYSMRHCY